MTIQESIVSQYKAGLLMLKNSITQCDDDIWIDTSYQNRTWHIAYHALFYTDLYLSADEKSFIPWNKAKDEYNFLGPLPWPPHNLPKIGDPYTREDILEYWGTLQGNLEGRILQDNLEDPSGFHWLSFNKLELHLYNIRHLQQHTGQLMDRLRIRRNIGISWIRDGR